MEILAGAAHRKLLLWTYDVFAQSQHDPAIVHTGSEIKRLHEKIVAVPWVLFGGIK